ncbi:MAG: hypothetical protein EOO70_05630, partial [Myxococcaceae bacterium]
MNVHSFARSIASLALVFAAGCSPDDDDDYRSGLLEVTSMKVEQLSTSTKSVVFVTLQLANRTKDATVSNMTSATFTFGDTSATFDVEGLTGHSCPNGAPWKVEPGGSHEVRLRLDMSTSPAVLNVGCSFNPDVPGFTDAVDVQAERSGPEVAADFTGSVQLTLQATLDPDAQHAKAEATAPISP